MLHLNPDQFANAIKRARQVHPKVTWLGGRRYSVTSSDRTCEYTVTFSVVNGQRFGACSCYAGQKHLPCFHIAAAAAVNIGMARLGVVERARAKAA